MVGTLWAVSDRVSAVLMTKLYALMTDGLHPAEALARAQAWLRDADATEIDEFSAAAGIHRPRTGEGTGTRSSGEGPRDAGQGRVQPTQWTAFVLVGDGTPP